MLDFLVSVWLVITPGMRTFPDGSLTVLPELPFMLVTSVRGLDGVGARVHFEDQVGRFLSGGSVVCGAFQLPQQT